MKNKIRVLFITALMAMLFSALCCHACAAQPPAADPAESLRIMYKGEDVGFSSLSIDIVSKEQIKLSAVSGKPYKSVDVIWKSNNEEIATVDEEGVVTVENEDGGTVSISCSSTDGSGRSCLVKLELVKKVHRMSLSHYVGLTVRAQSVVTLKPKFIAPDGSEYIPTDPDLHWEVYSGGEYAFFSNASGGTLCTNSVDSMKTVRVVVRSGNNAQAAAVLSLNVSPIVEKINIFNNGVDVTGKELSFPYEVKVQLTADCWPDQKSSAVKWSSSSGNISVADGLVSANGPGKAIITAAAVDGAGKSACVTLVFK